MAPLKTISKKDLDKLGKIPLLKPSDSEEAVREMDKKKRAREKKKAAARLKEDAEANLTAQEYAEKDTIRADPKMDKRTRTGKLGWITRKYKKLKEKRRLGNAAKKNIDERIDSDGDDDSEHDDHPARPVPVSKKLAAKEPAQVADGHDAVGPKPIPQDATGVAATHIIAKSAAKMKARKLQKIPNKAAAKDKTSRKAASPPAVLMRRSSSKITKRSAPELKNVGDHAARLADLILAIRNDHVAAYGPVSELLLRALGMLNKMEEEIEQEGPGEVGNIPAGDVEVAATDDAARESGERLDHDANAAAGDGLRDAVGNGDDDADNDGGLRQFVMDQSE